MIRLYANGKELNLLMTTVLAALPESQRETERKKPEMTSKSTVGRRNISYKKRFSSLVNVFTFLI
jgi:hypothetical protein